MSDIVDPEVRSRMMSSIGSKDTRPEMLVRRYLHARGFRYRLHDRSLPGSPDLVLRRYRAVIFVHGCFWHQHGHCVYATKPATRADFWSAKFDQNRRRDKRQFDDLKEAQWRIATVWECGLRDGRAAKTLERLADWIPGSDFLLFVPPTIAVSGRGNRRVAQVNCT